MEAKVDNAINAVEERMEAMVKSGQEETNPTVRAGQKDGSCDKLHRDGARRDHKNRTANVLASVEQRTQTKIEEIHLGLQAVTTSIDTRSKNLREEFDGGMQENASRHANN
jgi:hypothetical protein